VWSSTVVPSSVSFQLSNLKPLWLFPLPPLLLFVSCGGFGFSSPLSFLARCGFLYFKCGLFIQPRIWHCTHSLAYPLSRSGEATTTNGHTDILKAISATEVWLSGAEHRYLSKPAWHSPFPRLFDFQPQCGFPGTSLFSSCSKIGVPGQRYFGNKASNWAFFLKNANMAVVAT